MSVKVQIDILPQVMASIQKLASKEVLVGIPASNAGRDDGPLTNAALGFIHNYGSPARNIPARPFLEPGIESVKAEITRRMQDAGQLVLRGNEAALDKALTAVGIVAQGAVRRKITEGPFTPLAPATLAARRRRGFQGTRPLIETGQLRASISFVVTDKE